MTFNNYFLFILFCTIFVNPSYSQNGDQPDRKTLFMIVDGISDDVIQEVSTPHLDAIAEEGAFIPAYVGGGAGTYSETPTISAVGYNSLLTGTWANKHNVWGNEIKDPNYRYWTIFRYFKEQYPAKTMAVYSTWLDNRTKLIGTGLDATGRLQMDYYFDGFEQDTVRFPHDEATTYIRDIDNLVADEAAQNIRKEGPDMSWVYLQFTDNMGHQYGDHPKFYESIRLMDDQVGRIWEAVKEREMNNNEEWLVVITTDHGRSADTGKDHGGQSERERATWIVTNQNELNEYAQNYRVAVVDILPTIADFMEVSIPKYRAMELDGVSLMSEVDAVNLVAEKSSDLVNRNSGKVGEKIKLTWDSLDNGGKARVWITTTNHFRYGGEDHYFSLGEVDLSKEEAEFAIGMPDSELFKVVLETPHHYLNAWIIDR
ncbi:alkaline phosphatase family protein [Membranicola marinus]|uniref:Alkaline phosphatase family protein n=1 Tax=Membranihabitans marinus TaxID=1227546 RepID=A0A953I0I0_9BACT|nr:alkaline phosphatase family protein [Membranihabitans marinus]MBY5960151.1 alkaline phosphatase family protein [Membranihabitans marinus]